MSSTARRLAAVATAVGLTLALALVWAPAQSAQVAAARPAAVPSITKTVTTSSITATWPKAAGAKTYAVCLLPDTKAGTACHSYAPSRTTTEATFTGLTPKAGTDYYVQVRAYNEAGSTYSAKFPVDLAAASRPAAVTRIDKTVTTSSITATWPKAAGAKTYAVCLLTNGDAGTPCHSWAGSRTTTEATFTGLGPTPGTDYFVQVRAYNEAGSSYSAKFPVDLVAKPARPGVPGNVKHSVTSSGVTISWSKATQATRYAVCLMTWGGTSECFRQSPSSTSTTATFTDLKPTGGADYFYRIFAYNGPRENYSSNFTSSRPFDLPVSTVPKVSSTLGGDNRTTLAWDPATNASTYEVQTATNSGMTTGLVSATTTGPSHATTAMKPGTTYHVRVRGINDSTRGAWSPTTSVRRTPSGFTATVLTYNLCGEDKCINSTNKMSKWSSTRKKLAGALARSSGADVIATQESQTTRTNFITELPGYSLGSYLSAKSLFYKTSKYNKIRSGTVTLDLAGKKYAVWAELEDKATGSRFIVSDAHLVSGKGKSLDDKRKVQTDILVKAIAKINPNKLPTVFAGDFNSNKSNANQSRYKGGYDAPLRVFRAAGIPDTYDTAQERINSTWNSANQGINPPLRNSDHVDHVFASSDVKATNWRVWMSLRNSTTYNVPFPSDHNAIRVQLQIPGR